MPECPRNTKKVLDNYNKTIIYNGNTTSVGGVRWRASECKRVSEEYDGESRIACM